MDLAQSKRVSQTLQQTLAAHKRTSHLHTQRAESDPRMAFETTNRAFGSCYANSHPSDFDTPGRRLSSATIGERICLNPPLTYVKDDELAGCPDEFLALASTNEFNGYRPYDASRDTIAQRTWTGPSSRENHLTAVQVRVIESKLPHPRKQPSSSLPTRTLKNDSLRDGFSVWSDC